MEATSLEEILSDGAPNFLIDPIVNSLYCKPVVVPSGKTISRSVVIRNNYTDPYTQSKLKEVRKTTCFLKN